ncbi:MAG: Hdr-like menaquinol oxidoreductase cytochrome c subunit [Alphaproteobacteria bacterium]|nr:Hdr-like menaquinol oxidoreductase cytochrome c subunit [Alphaproteobacteria bacterium]MBF0128885.1 Hdr-like menaquinol oxidoreductase cytochrome c subunit [Alphaproteobacteria bacterium]
MTGLRLVLVMVVAALFGVLPALAGDGPFPTIPKGKGGKCVEDTQFMRRNHMDLLKHQRDETMREGIRTTEHGLQGCISCHAVQGADGKPVTIKSEEHFCNACHSYAGVSPDCFACHASVPPVGASPPGAVHGQGPTP